MENVGVHCIFHSVFFFSSYRDVSSRYDSRSWKHNCCLARSSSCLAASPTSFSSSQTISSLLQREVDQEREVERIKEKGGEREGVSQLTTFLSLSLSSLHSFSSFVSSTSSVDFLLRFAVGWRARDQLFELFFGTLSTKYNTRHKRRRKKKYFSSSFFISFGPDPISLFRHLTDSLLAGLWNLPISPRYLIHTMSTLTVYGLLFRKK